MTGEERQRLGLALVAGIAVHVVAFLILEFGDWRTEPFPEFSGPLYVSMEPVERDTPEDEAAEEPEPEGLQSERAGEEPQPETTPEAETEAEPEPEAEPEAEPESEPESASEPEAPAEEEPPAQQTPQEQASPDQQAPSSQAPPDEEGQQESYEFTRRELQGDGPAQEQPGDRQTAPEADEFQRLPPEGESGGEQEELPEWATQPRETVEDAGFSTEDVSDEEVEGLAEKVATDPEFQRSLSNVVSALESRSDGDDTADSSQPGADGDSDGEPGADDTDGDGSAGDSDIEWVGSGSRELLNPPAVPEGFFSASDFGGSVPAEAPFVVVFEVDSRGNVVPGSVIFQRGAGFVQAQEKLRSRVRSWSFEPAEGAPEATGIFTLVVRRDDIE